MSNFDLEKIKLEVEKMTKQNEFLKNIREDDTMIVKKAVDIINFKESLTDKQKIAFDDIQKSRSTISNILVNVNLGKPLTKFESGYLTEELKRDDEPFVSSKHVRLTLVQDILLEYFAKNNVEKRNQSEFIRHIILEKLCQCLEELE